MESSKYVYDNAAVLSAYQKLEKDNKHPVLGVWRDESLLIVSHDSTGFFNFIVNVIKQIVYKIFKCIGFIKINPTRIQEIKNKVKGHYLSHVEHHYNDRLMSLQSQETDLTSRLQQLNGLIESARGELRTINSDLSDARTLVSQRDSIQSQVSDLLQRKASLEGAITDIPNRQAELASIERSIREARQRLCDLSSDISQKDYKTQATRALSENVQLRVSLEEAKRKECHMPWKHFP